ncbi:MAG: cytochrome C assembly family protein [Aeromonas sp.]
MIVLCVLALLGYLLAIVSLLKQLLSQGRTAGRSARLWGGFALLAHAGAAAIDGSQLASTQLSMLTIASFISWLISAIMTLGAARLNSWLLLPVVYGFSALVLSANALIPDHYRSPLEAQPGLMLHIALALLAYAMLMIASLFALQLAWVSRQLKQRKLAALPALPPLLSLERQLFSQLWVGVGLLSASMLVGVLFIDGLFGQGIAHKTVLTLGAWLLYVLLLWGHHQRGWRGRTVISLSLCASALLTLAYFGSRFVKEVLLS